MPATVQIVGLRRFVSMMRKLGDETLGRRVRMAHLEVASMVAGRVRSAAPRGTDAERDKHPGRLAAATKPRATQRMAKVEVGKGLIYAKPVIFGWHRHHITANKYPYHVFDEIVEEVPALYNAAIKAAIEEARSA